MKFFFICASLLAYCGLLLVTPKTMMAALGIVGFLTLVLALRNLIDDSAQD